MKFEIDFNDSGYSNDKLLIEKLGAYYVPTGSDKYPPFEILQIEVEDFEKLKDIISIIDKELNTISSAVIQFDPPTLYIDFYQKKGVS
jgi:hypothetical protein